MRQPRDGVRSAPLPQQVPGVQRCQHQVQYQHQHRRQFGQAAVRDEGQVGHQRRGAQTQHACEVKQHVVRVAATQPAASEMSAPIVATSSASRHAAACANARRLTFMAHCSVPAWPPGPGCTDSCARPGVQAPTPSGQEQRRHCVRRHPCRRTPAHDDHPDAQHRPRLLRATLPGSGLEVGAMSEPCPVPASTLKQCGTRSCTRVGPNIQMGYR